MLKKSRQFKKGHLDLDLETSKLSHEASAVALEQWQPTKGLLPFWPAWAYGMALKDFFKWLIQYKLASK